jgi:2-methylcitrate dehydratase
MAPSKAVVDGMVAASAVTATLLARGGLGGKRAAFEGDDGYVAALARGWNEDVVLAPLERFRILDVYTKLYNTVKCGQTAVSAALRLRDRIGDLGRIRSITVALAERDWRNQLQDEGARRRPPNRDTANHSAVFCVAAALVAGDLQSAQFSPESLTDPRTLALVDRTTLRSEERYTAYWPGANPAGVRIELEDGTVIEDEELYSPGHPQNLLTPEQLRGKFRAQVEPILGPDRTTDLITAVDGVADLPDLTPLIDLCRPAAEMEMEFTA